VDKRTTPTGRFGTYERKDWLPLGRSVVKYEIHEPEQDAFGDWAAISIGGQYYLFGDYHVAKKGIKIGIFTSDDINKEFEFIGELGHGHPDRILSLPGFFWFMSRMALPQA